jgi:hypothetical protein
MRRRPTRSPARARLPELPAILTPELARELMLEEFVTLSPAERLRLAADLLEAGRVDVARLLVELVRRTLVRLEDSAPTEI